MPICAGAPIDLMTARADRILLVLPSLERGGGERVMLQLAGSFLRAGREVHVVALLGGGPLRSMVPQGVSLHELIDADDAPRGLALAWEALPRLASLIRVLRPNAVLSTMTGTNLLAALACNRPRVHTRLVLREASSLVNTKSALKRLAMRLLYRYADGLVAVSDGVAQDLRGLGLSDERIHVIRNPVDAERLQQLAAVDLPAAIQGNAPYIISLGRLTEAKDFPTLLRAYAASALRDSHSLVIVGGGEERSNLDNFVRDLGLADRILLVGAMDNPYRVLAEAKLLVLSSRWEGYPSVLLEALALGVSVVSTDCEHGPREILDGGRYGRLVPVGDVGALANAMDAELQLPSPRTTHLLESHSPRLVASSYLMALDDSCANDML
jgi:glycosyltransferase involved in cell wall biosynthesis